MASASARWDVRVRRVIMPTVDAGGGLFSIALLDPPRFFRASAERARPFFGEGLGVPASDASEHRLIGVDGASPRRFLGGGVDGLS